MEAIRRKMREEQLEQERQRQTQLISGAQITSLPPRDKHAPPPKVKMYQPVTASPARSGSSRDNPIVFGETSRMGQTPHPASPHRNNAGPSSQSLSKKKTPYAPFVPPSAAAPLRTSPIKNNNPFYPPLPPLPDAIPGSVYDDVSELPEDSVIGPSIDAQTRDQQIQDLLSNMVSVVDVSTDESAVIPGLKCTLLTHQVQGVAWMKEREQGRAKGGILADDMGLGKTVQTLALILANRPGTEASTIDREPLPEPSAESAGKTDVPLSRKKLNSKTTLIVAPLAVIRQWEREVQEKTNAGLKVYVYHGSTRTKFSSTFAKYDIVITTYTTAATEYNAYMAKLMADAAGQSSAKGANRLKDDSDADSRSSSPKFGDAAFDSESSLPSRAAPAKAKRKPATASNPIPLFDFDWLRIVLDEAQNIKNRNAKCSLACFRLSQRSTSRWCLTGTPIQNDAYEMFSLIHFLRVPPFNDYAHFKAKIGEPLKSTNQNRVNWGMKRLCFVLQTIMLRRTKEAKTADGRSILNLPSRTVELVSLDFESPDEKEFYEGLQERIRATMDKEAELEQRTGRKRSFIQTLILLLRLRQACSHPSLVTKSVHADAGAIMTTTKPVNGSVDGKPAARPRKRDDHDSDSDSDDDFVDAAASAAANDDDDDGLTALLSSLTVGTRRCEQCHAILPADHELGTGAASSICASCASASARHSLRLFAPDSSSTKVSKMLSLLSDIRRADSSEKTIVFSQFTSFLDVVESHLTRQSFRYVRYDGSMRPQEREHALSTIRTDPHTTVILISFKAGSTGLNLTCCSKVILMDLWWNPQIEEQAFDRSHRLGQTRNVTIYKLSIKDTVEERILLLQEKKRALAKAALSGSKFSKANKLDSKEIWFLFNGSD